MGAEQKTIEDFIEKIYPRRYESIFTIVTGPNQSGKTNLSLLIMEIMFELGLAERFGSNVPVEAPFEVDFINDFQTLEQTCRMLNPNPKKKGLKRYVYFLSEMGKIFPRDEAWKNTKFIRKLQTVRKYGLNLLGDAVDRVDGRIVSASFAHGVFHKAKDRLTTAVYEDWLDRGKRIPIFEIPKTIIDFDTYHSADFYMEPQTPDNVIVPLNYEHEIVFKYRDLGSWKKVGVTTQEGKRCVFKVIDFHRTHCLPHLAIEKQESAPIEAEIAKDSIEVTE